MPNFKELRVWKEAMELAKLVYVVSAKFPADEKYGLKSQVNRAGVSVASNIAEGAGRGSNKEFAQFLKIALGSAFEVETQMILAEAFGFVTEADNKKLMQQVSDVQRMLNGLINKL